MHWVEHIHGKRKARFVTRAEAAILFGQIREAIR
jgi:hypothetical protein